MKRSILLAVCLSIVPLNCVFGAAIYDPADLTPGYSLIDFNQFYVDPNDFRRRAPNPLVIDDVTFSAYALYFRDITQFPIHGTEVDGVLLDPDWRPLTISFANPVSEVLLAWADTNYPGNFLRAYDSDGNLLEEAEVTELGPQVWRVASWIGFQRSTNDIASVVMVAPNGDDMGLDNLHYYSAPPPPPIPEPLSLAVWSLLGFAGAGYITWRRRR